MSLQENLVNDALKALRAKVAVTLGPEQTVGDAIGEMQASDEGYVVVTEHGKPIGVFTERDVLTKILGSDETGGCSMESPMVNVMTASPTVIRAEQTVAEVIGKMHHGGFRHLPVVDESGFLTGVVSVKGIVEYVVEHFPAAVFNLPPDPGQKSVAREGA
ncbi:MAG: CBS domain-containing protein [Planctomycetota bacterium]|jgi:CBS domain-containing protein